MAIVTGRLGHPNALYGTFVLGGLTHATQQIVQFPDEDVILTYLGEEWVANHLVNNTGPKVYIAWGTGTGTPGKEDTELFNEDLLTPRHLATIDLVDEWRPTSQPNPYPGRTSVYVATATLLATNNITVTEVGLFDAKEGGNLYMHGTYTATDLEGLTYINAGDKITFHFVLDPI